MFGSAAIIAKMHYHQNDFSFQFYNKLADELPSEKWAYLEHLDVADD